MLLQFFIFLKTAYSDPKTVRINTKLEDYTFTLLITLITLMHIILRYFEVVPSTVTEFWIEIQAYLQTVIQTNIIFKF